MSTFIVVKSKLKLCNRATYIREFKLTFFHSKRYITLFQFQSKGPVRMSKVSSDSTLLKSPSLFFFIFFFLLSVSLDYYYYISSFLLQLLMRHVLKYSQKPSLHSSFLCIEAFQKDFAGEESLLQGCFYQFLSILLTLSRYFPAYTECYTKTEGGNEIN